MSTTTKNTVIAIETIHGESSVGYVKCYKDGSKWTWKSVGSIDKASKFDYKTADWKSSQMQKRSSYGEVLFYPIEIN